MQISVGFDVHKCLLLFGFANLERLELSEMPLLHNVLQIRDLVLVGLQELKIQPVVCTICVPATIHTHTFVTDLAELRTQFTKHILHQPSLSCLAFLCFAVQRERNSGGVFNTFEISWLV